MACKQVSPAATYLTYSPNVQGLNLVQWNSCSDWCISWFPNLTTI